MTAPRLVDLFAGAGGCTAGYQRAGFTVTAVDVDPAALRRNPADETVEADAMTVLADPDYLDTFDAVHASPPCQAFTAALRSERANGDLRVDLLAPTLALLAEWHARTGRPYVVENVPGAPMPAGTVEVCGAHRRAHDTRTGRTLRLRRHRLFYSPALPLTPLPCGCDTTPIGGVYGAGAHTLEQARARGGGYTPPTSVQRALIGAEWMTARQAQQAIPPDYTEAIGAYLIDALALARA